jgi:hypothetical protein
VARANYVEEAEEVDDFESPDDPEVVDVDVVALESLDSVDFAAPSLVVEPSPLADALEERESVMYQPLPLKTMPTGWMILRRLPPHCSHVVSGGSEKLCRFSMTSLQAVQV